MSFFFLIFHIQSPYTCERCLAHVINLPTQQLISGYSISPHYDPSKPDHHEPDVMATKQDEIGLIRAIAVKVLSVTFIDDTLIHCVIKVGSSAKRKALFSKLQTRVDIRP